MHVQLVSAEAARAVGTFAEKTGGGGGGGTFSVRFCISITCTANVNVVLYIVSMC